MAALLSKDKLRKDLDEAVAATMGQAVSEEPSKGKKEDTEKIEKLRDALRKKIEVCNDPSPRVDSPYLAHQHGFYTANKSNVRPRMFSKRPDTAQRANSMGCTAM